MKTKCEWGCHKGSLSLDACPLINSLNCQTFPDQAKALILWCKVMSRALASISGWKQPNTARISSYCHDLTKSHLCPSTPSKSIWCGSAFVQHPMVVLNNPVPLTGRFQQENILTKGADTAPLCLMKTHFQLWGKEGSLHPGALYCQKQQIAKKHCEELGIESPELINPSLLFTWHSLSSQRGTLSATWVTSSLQRLEGQHQAPRQQSQRWQPGARCWQCWAISSFWGSSI